MPHRRRWSVLAGVAIAVLALAPDAASAVRTGPSPVARVHVQGATSTSVTLSWQNPRGAGFTATVVRFAKGEHAPPTPKRGTPGGRAPGGRHTLTVRHLRPGTRYSFALFAYYGAGHYAHRSTVRATTAPDAVRLVQPFDHESYVAITWRSPSSATYATTIVRYAAGHRAPATPSAGTGVRLTSAKATEARLAHLAPHTAYSVSVWLRDRAHRYSPVATAHFTTLGATSVATGTVSGTVRDRAAHPLAGVVVALFNSSGDTSVSATTGADGAYSLTAPVGDYEEVFIGDDATGGDSDATGYVYDNREFVLNAHDTRTEDAALAAGGMITGKVTDPAGHPLQGVAYYPDSPNAYVNPAGVFFSGLFSLAGGPTTAADGTFAIRGLPAEAFHVCYDASVAAVSGGDFDAVGYAGRCEHGSAAVGAGDTHALAPVALAPAHGAAVSGTVTDSAGHPVADVIVQVRGHDTPAFGAAYTDSAGHYRVAALAPGRYDICADPSAVQIPAAATGDAATCRFAAADLHAGQSASVNLRLPRGGAAAGRLTGPGGHPVVGAQVYLRLAGSESGGSGVTDGRGQFEVKHLAPGRYTACFDPMGATATGAPTGLQADCYRGGEVVEVRAGVVRLGLDAALPAGGAVSGTVLNADHTPAADVEVDAEPSSGNGDGSWTQTDAAGHYTIAGLSSDRYDICVMPTADFSGDATCRFGVRVTAGRALRGVNITVQPSGSITVTVQDAGGHPVAGVDAVAVSACGPDSDCGKVPLFSTSKSIGVISSVMTAADGTATLSGLPPTVGTKANYAICVFAFYGTTTTGDPSTGYLDDCTAKGSFDRKVTAGANPPVTFTLQPAGAVRGRITTADGHPLAGVRVKVSGSSSTDYVDPDMDPSQFGIVVGPQADVTTDADGRYLVRGVQPGGQTVCVDAADAVDATGAATPGGFVDQCVGGQPGGTNDGTPVTVPTADTVDAGDLVLTAGAAITGRVLNAANGRPVARAQVIVFDGLGEAVNGVFTDTSGRYLFSRLLADDDLVCFWADGFRPQCYDGVAWSGGALPTHATKVTTAPGITRTLKDARLRRP